eukprot:gene27727-7373_t
MSREYGQVSVALSKVKRCVVAHRYVVHFPRDPSPRRQALAQHSDCQPSALEAHIPAAIANSVGALNHNPLDVHIWLDADQARSISCGKGGSLQICPDESFSIAAFCFTRIVSSSVFLSMQSAGVPKVPVPLSASALPSAPRPRIVEPIRKRSVLARSYNSLDTPEQNGWDSLSVEEIEGWEVSQGPPTPLLDTVNFPVHLKNFKTEQLRQFCKELRSDIVHKVSKTGGHLSSSLGVVELTVALHYVFNTPEDKIIWDVGHQAYGHKILTGRRDKMDTIRTTDGLSGKFGRA